MEAARTSETSVVNYFKRQYIPEDKSELHTRRRENLKSQTSIQEWALNVRQVFVEKLTNPNSSTATNFYTEDIRFEYRTYHRLY
jgi:hypothetical protein